MKSINIWITRNCNLRCNYCYEGLEKESGVLHREDMKYLIDFIQKEGENNISINFHGGEPMLFPQIIFDICDALQDTNSEISYSLTTNGTMLTAEIIEKILFYNIYLSISIDGNKSSHNLNRKYNDGTGSYDEAIRGALLAKEKGVRLRIRMTVTPATADFLVENVKHLWSCGFSNIVAVPDLFSNQWTKDKIRDIEKSIIELLEYPKKKDFAFFEEGLKAKGRCMGGINSCNIDTGLNLYPCSFVVGMEEFCIGNIKVKKEEAILGKIEELSHCSNVECVGCGMEKYCVATRCKLINKVLTGDYLSASPVICAFEHMVYNLDQKLIHTDYI